MAIYARKPKSNYTPPPEGLYQAVCCDVLEPYKRDDFEGGGQHDATRIVWQLDLVNEATGKPYQVSQEYRLSLHEKAKLCQHLQAWRGKKFTAEEKQGFDLEKLIGVNCQLQVTHSTSKTTGDTYANVEAILGLTRGIAKMAVSGDFVRRKDRDEGGDANEDAAPTDGAGSEEVPF